MEAVRKPPGRILFELSQGRRGLATSREGRTILSKFEFIKAVQRLLHKLTPTRRTCSGTILFVCAHSLALAGGVNVAPPPPNVVQHPVDCITDADNLPVKIELCFVWYGNITPKGKVNFISMSARLYAPVDGPPVDYGYLYSLEILTGYHKESWEVCGVYDHIRTASSTVCSISGYKKLQEGFTVRARFKNGDREVTFYPV